jgi:hypothetical protein
MPVTSAEVPMNCTRLLPLSVAGGLVMLASALTGAPEKADAENPFQKKLLQVTKNYKSWGRVDDEARWAPLDCRAPNPAKVRFSASPDADTHGQKLYSLFAKDRRAYITVGDKTEVAVGQVVVKESWLPEEVKDQKLDSPHRIETTPPGGPPFSHKLSDDQFDPYAEKDGKLYKASKPAGLFVMMKLYPNTEGTDNGWVYGTLSADGKEVTAAGKLESCMKCHQDAKHDRLFGLSR